MKKVMCAAAMACAVAVASAAGTWWVDAENGVDAAGYGSTSNRAFRTLQYAHDAAASGDTVKVLPGVYADTSSDTTYGATRLNMHGKKLYLKAVGGPDATVIEGSFAPGSAYGYAASGAVRCITCRDDVAAQSIIEGFTFRNGSTVDASTYNSPKSGGAVLSASGNSTFITNGPFVVCCRIENCSSPRSGPTAGGVFVRCLFRYNNIEPGKYFGFQSTFMNCVIARNWSNAATGTGYATAYLEQDTLFNCTIADNFLKFYPTRPSYLYNCLVSATEVATGGGTFSGCFTDSDSVRALMGPAAGDCRLRSGAESSAQTGDAAYLAYVTLPDGDAPFKVNPRIDFYGNPIAESGTIAAGACQVASTPAAGAVQLKTARMTLTAGVPGVANSYVYPEAYPTNYRVRAAFNDVRRVVYYSYSHNGGSYRHFPLMDDSTDVIPPPGANETVQVSIGRQSTAIAWADPSADPSEANGTEAHPYPTLQAAFDSVCSLDSANGCVVLAKAGTYGTGQTDFDYQGYTGHTRLLITNTCRIVAVDGCARTFLVGSPDTSTLSSATAPGCGANAVNAIAMTSLAQVQGFTITGSYSTTGSGYYTPGRGPIFTYGNDLEVTDCVISNNVGAYYAVGPGRYWRCRITGNRGVSGVLGNGNYLGACVIAGNTIDTANKFQTAASAQIYHCSIVGNSTSYALADNASAVFVNNAVDDGGIKLFDVGGSYGCVYDGFASYEGGQNYLKYSPCFADKSKADLHLAYGSPATRAAVSPGDTNANGWWLYVTTDIDGNPIRFDSDGRPLPGAYGDTAQGAYVVAGQGGVAVENGVIGANEPTAEHPLVLTASDNTRPVSGFLVNGVTNLFEELPDHALTVASAGGGMFIEAIYSGDWYAAPDGDDSATGFYPSAAKTLQGALTNANLVVGDRVLALPGVYATGEMAQGEGIDIKARAVVPGGVTLESTGGRDVTFIRGRAATVEDAAPYAGYPLNGMGADAMRCVYLKAGSRLKGFTLTDGHTRAWRNGTTQDHSSADMTGGGVGAAGADRVASWVEDCAISNCAAYRGGGAMAVKCNRCLFSNNYASYIGGAASDSRMYNSISRDNTVAVSGTRTESSGFAYAAMVDGCTALDALAFANASSVCRNTLVQGRFVSTASTTIFVTNCVFNSDNSSLNDTWLAATPGAIVTNAAAFGLDENMRPKIDESVAVDAADEAVGECPTEYDLTGVQRIYNGRADIGALEADWRTVYAKDIARSRRFSVAKAGQQVVESAEKTVRLAPGETMEVFWAGDASRAVPTTLKVRVTGTGTLTVAQDDGVVLGEIVVADGVRELAFSVPVEGRGLSMSYARTDGDTGYAEILSSRGSLGFQLIFM